MGGIKTLRAVQMGKETTQGTAVAATSIMRVEGAMIEDKRETIFAMEDIGIIGGVDRSYVPKVLAGLSIPDNPATFEQLGYIFGSGIKGVAGVQDGAGTDYVYTYTFPTTSKNTIHSRTWEGGDDQQFEEFAYGFVESFGLNGKGGESMMFAAELTGRQAAPTTKTAGLSVPAVEEILFSKGSLYIDDSGGSIGATQVSNTFRALTLNCKTGWIPKWTADGQLYFSFAAFVGDELTFSIEFEHDASAVAEIADWRAESTRLIRMKFPGSAVATPGTTYSTKLLQMDFAGKWESFEKIDEVDGNDIVRGMFRMKYSSTDSLKGEIIVVNELSALP